MTTLCLDCPGLPATLRQRLASARQLLALTVSTWILALISLPLIAAALLIAAVLTTAPSTALAASPPPSLSSDAAALPKAVAEMEQLDRMRISLASTLEGRTEEPTMETMKEVCMPVGRRAKEIGKENGWQVRQVAAKFRNPDHAPAGPAEKEVIDLFARHPGITGLWETDTGEEGAGLRYYRRIDVQPSCLACHGTKDSRPAFVKERYPADRAFDFSPGDLRGMYVVTIPEVRQALSDAAVAGS